MSSNSNFLRATVFACALGAGAAAQAAPIVFSFTGTIDSATTGYRAGDAFAFSVTLDASAAQNVRQTPAGTTCCASSLAWSEDLPAQPNLWSAVTGTGLTGNWSFAPDYYTTSSLTMVTTDPARTPFRGDTLQLQSTNIALTSPSGLFANGLEVIGFQVSTVFLGLSAVGSYGYDNVFSNTMPDSTALFSSMAGTYARDTLFGSTAFIRVRDPSGGPTTLRFTPTQVSVSNFDPTPTVPEPRALALLAMALAATAWRKRRLALR